MHDVNFTINGLILCDIKVCIKFSTSQLMKYQYVLSKIAKVLEYTRKKPERSWNWLSIIKRKWLCLLVVDYSRILFAKYLI